MKEIHSLTGPFCGRQFAWAVSIGSLMLLGGCGKSEPHYKVTAEVDVNGKTYSGSSVLAFPCDRFSQKFPMGVNSCLVKGEAVVVDLSPKGTLFLAFRGKWGDISSMVISIIEAGGQDPFTGDMNALPNQWTLPESALPTMVTFKDARRPQSVEQVDPSDLSATFGSGVRLRSVRVQKTTDPITVGKVEKVLPWVGVGPGATYLTGRGGSSPDDGFAGKLQHDNFKFGV